MGTPGKKGRADLPTSTFAGVSQAECAALHSTVAVEITAQAELTRLQIEMLAKSVAANHEEGRAAMSSMLAVQNELKGTAIAQGSSLVHLVEKSGEQNHRISKAEDAIGAVTKAVEKDQALTEAAKQAAWKATVQTRWFVATMLALAGVVSAIMFEVLSHA